MRPALDVLGRALAAAGRRPLLVLALYLPGALLSSVTVLPLLLGLGDLSALGPWLELAAAGGQAEALAELGAAAMANPDGAAADAARVVGSTFAFATLLVLIGLLVQGLAYSFVVGGLLAELRGGREAPFWPACRAWFGPMLRYGLLGLTLFAALVGLGLVTLALLPARGEPFPTLDAAGAALWLSVANGLVEYGRASMLARDDRRALPALGRALALLVQPRRLGPALLLWLVLAALGSVHLGGGAALQMAIPATAVPAAFLAQQAVALVGAWLKLLRLAVAVELGRPPVG